MMTRILAAAVGLAIVVPALVYGGPHGVFWLVFPFLFVALQEYARMAVDPLRQVDRLGFLAVGGVLYAVAALLPERLGVVLSLALIGALVLPMLRDADVAHAAKSSVRWAFGLVYVPVTLASLARIRAEHPDGLALVVLLLCVTWGGDTGAYFAGRMFGRTPLFPRVSPKKTVEGLIGGAVLSMGLAAVVKGTMGLDIGWVGLLALAVLLDVAGVVGDLAESMLKRAFGVKDSGSIMPGHGGILDRVDSLMFSGPLLLAALEIRTLLGG
jgi:phosphatidate cytidylyltransferase